MACLGFFNLSSLKQETAIRHRSTLQVEARCRGMVQNNKQTKPKPHGKPPHAWISGAGELSFVSCRGFCQAAKPRAPSQPFPHLARGGRGGCCARALPAARMRSEAGAGHGIPQRVRGVGVRGSGGRGEGGWAELRRAGPRPAQSNLTCG